jgi:hypothetical protein
VRAERFALGHAVLASLPVTEVVTTNYDTLFERAVAAAGRGFAVLPYDVPSRDHDGWLLKLHGCVKRGLQDIVLTRGDYFRYADRRAALAGIVQALLITRSMVFAGFSLRDENFLRIADDVRKAIQGESGAVPHFGTALLLGDEPLLGELWAGELDGVAVGTDDQDGRGLDLSWTRCSRLPRREPNISSTTASSGLSTKGRRSFATRFARSSSTCRRRPVRRRPGGSSRQL